MASLFITALEQVSQSHKTDDDLIDRLNHRFTVILLVIFTTFISAKQFIGDPISCWSPPQFSAPQIAYTNSICWLKGTYYLENDRRLIPHRTQNSEFRIAYYQFVPYMLLVMAMLFYFPHMLWRNMSRHIGFDLRLLIQDMKKVLKNDIHQVAVQIHIALKSNSSKYIVRHHKYPNRLFEIFQRSHLYHNRLSLLYVLIKILYIINCLGQFYLLNIFLSFPFHKFGIEWLLNTLEKVHNKLNTQSNESKWFPRVVMCEFMVRHLGSNQHWMSVQCNLPINLFNELIFLIIWGWFIFLSCLTCVSFILCLLSIYSNLGHRSIRKYLYMNISKLNEDKQDEFIENYLRWDGILILRIISQNTNDIIMADLVGDLYKIYSKSIKIKFHKNNQIQLNEHYMSSDSSAI